MKQPDRRRGPSGKLRGDGRHRGHRVRGAIDREGPASSSSRSAPQRHGQHEELVVRAELSVANERAAGNVAILVISSWRARTPRRRRAWACRSPGRPAGDVESSVGQDSAGVERGGGAGSRAGTCSLRRQDHAKVLTASERPATPRTTARTWSTGTLYVAGGNDRRLSARPCSTTSGRSSAPARNGPRSRSWPGGPSFAERWPRRTDEALVLGPPRGGPFPPFLPPPGGAQRKKKKTRRRARRSSRSIAHARGDHEATVSGSFRPLVPRRPIAAASSATSRVTHRRLAAERVAMLDRERRDHVDVDPDRGARFRRPRAPRRNGSRRRCARIS